MLQTPGRQYCFNCATHLEKKSENSWYCSSCDYVQYESPKPATELILRREGKILISERGRQPDKGKFDMPGGFVEPDETAEQAALREAKEELNLDSGDVENMHYLMSFATYYPYGKEVYRVLVVVFVADLSVTAELSAQDDVSSLRWIGESDLDSVAWSRPYHKQNATRVLTGK